MALEKIEHSEYFIPSARQPRMADRIEEVYEVAYGALIFCTFGVVDAVVEKVNQLLFWNNPTGTISESENKAVEVES